MRWAASVGSTKVGSHRASGPIAAHGRRSRSPPGRARRRAVGSSTSGLQVRGEIRVPDDGGQFRGEFGPAGTGPASTAIPAAIRKPPRAPSSTMALALMLSALWSRGRCPCVIRALSMPVTRNLRGGTAHSAWPFHDCRPALGGHRAAGFVRYARTWRGTPMRKILLAAAVLVAFGAAGAATSASAAPGLPGAVSAPSEVVSSAWTDEWSPSPPDDAPSRHGHMMRHHHHRGHMMRHMHRHHRM